MEFNKQGLTILICDVYSYAWTIDTYAWFLSCICGHVHTFPFHLGYKISWSGLSLTDVDEGDIIIKHEQQKKVLT